MEKYRTHCLNSGDIYGSGDLTVAPLFVSPATGDFRLATLSPCIDAGDDNVVASGDTDN